jgi:hypothetical protein
MAHGATATQPYGMMAEFDSPEALIEAARQTRLEGYRRFDCYTPFPIHGLTEAMGVREAKVPWTVFICGLIGALFGFGLQTYTSAIDYPLNVGGRDLISWPYFIPITFECMVLFAAFGAFIGCWRTTGCLHPITLCSMCPSSHAPAWIDFSCASSRATRSSTQSARATFCSR